MTFNEYYKPYNEQLELSWSQKKRIELYEFIFEPKTYFSKICSLLISIVIILAIICSCLETLKRFRGMLIWKIIEFSSSLVFLIEYILKLGAVTNRNKYIRTSCHFIDFVSMIPLFFVFVSEFIRTPALPTSDPVPAVVGIAIIGNILLGSASIHWSPIS